MNLRGVMLLAATLAGCGRIGFDEADAWAAHSTLILDRYDAGETLLDFPVALVLSEDRVDFDLVRPDGSDLRVYDESGTILPLELEAARPYVAWVRVPRIEGRTTRLTVSYGDTSAPVAMGPVWPDADAVWHFGGGGTIDSSPHHHDAVPYGNASPSDGFRTSGYGFDGASALLVPDTDWMPVAQLTIYGMMRLRSTTGFHSLVSRENAASAASDFWLGSFNGMTRVGIDTIAGSSGIDTGTVAPERWDSYALVYDGFRLYSFFDGQSLSSKAISGDVLYSNGNAVMLGAARDNLDLTNQGSTPDCDFVTGEIDEIRIEHVARSAAWIAATGISIGDGWITYGAIEYD
ncbi:MAG TPA: LamG-like jellyroll fold domain-containing protein [Kofleriaceae bacterium]|nr:LamG-like jellyroll fold domain-containing protein [Kofleriaceae bacterium]